MAEQRSGFTKIGHVTWLDKRWSGTVNVSQNRSFKLIKPTDPELPSVISASVGNPTDENIETVLASYFAEGNKLIGCIQNGKLVGVIGFEFVLSNAIIRHVSVLHCHRTQNIGRQLIHQMNKQFSPRTVLAETDGDSVGFYQSLKFKCVAFEGPFGTRYRCELSVP